MIYDIKVASPCITFIYDYTVIANKYKDLTKHFTKMLTDVKTDWWASAFTFATCKGSIDQCLKSKKEWHMNFKADIWTDRHTALPLCCFAGHVVRFGGHVTMTADACGPDGDSCPRVDTVNPGTQRAPRVAAAGRGTQRGATTTAAVDDPTQNLRTLTWICWPFSVKFILYISLKFLLAQISNFNTHRYKIV